MAGMTHRERVVKALNHEAPDRVPIDYGVAATANIHLDAYSRLIKHLGSDEETQDAVDPYERRLLMAAPSEEMQIRFQNDMRELHIGAPEIVPEERLGPNAFKDEWGVKWEKPEDGHFINVTGPFQEGEPTLADLEAYRWPVPRDPARLRGVKEEAIRLRDETDYAIILNLHDAVVAGCQRLRGFGEWMEDLVMNPAFSEGLMERVLSVRAGIAEYVLEEVGDYVDVVLFPDDLGFQDRPYMRPSMYTEKVKPYHRQLVEAIKKNTSAKVLMHSDGSIYKLLPDIIDIGVDAINPVQHSAKDMESSRLKAEFGRDLSFHGGVDNKQVLPWGTPEDVPREVKDRIRELGSDGGYVLASVHNIQSEVPAENIVAMFDAAIEYGEY